MKYLILILAMTANTDTIFANNFQSTTSNIQIFTFEQCTKESEQFRADLTTSGFSFSCVNNFEVTRILLSEFTLRINTNTTSNFYNNCYVDELYEDGTGWGFTIECN